MLTDPISDMLARLRNALAVKKNEVVLPFSTIKFAIAKILEAEGYVGAVTQSGEGKERRLRIALKYDNSFPAIRTIKRVSTPGRRVYAKAAALPRVQSGFGIAVISTPSGLMTNKEARARRLGGEIICEVS
jgi:small subunit ribosomal protein S8